MNSETKMLYIIFYLGTAECMQYPTITKCAVEYSTFGEISGTSNLDYNDYPMVILLLIKPLSFIMVYPPPGKGMGLIIFFIKHFSNKQNSQNTFKYYLS